MLLLACPPSAKLSRILQTHYESLTLHGNNAKGPSIKLNRQDARQTLLGALEGFAKVHDAVFYILSGHLMVTSTPNLTVFHDDEHVWQKQNVLALTA